MFRLRFCWDILDEETAGNYLKHFQQDVRRQWTLGPYTPVTNIRTRGFLHKDTRVSTWGHEGCFLLLSLIITSPSLLDVGSTRCKGYLPLSCSIFENRWNMAKFRGWKGGIESGIDKWIARIIILYAIASIFPSLDKNVNNSGMLNLWYAIVKF